MPAETKSFFEIDAEFLAKRCEYTIAQIAIIQEQKDRVYIEKQRRPLFRRYCLFFKERVGLESFEDAKLRIETEAVWDSPFEHWGYPSCAYGDTKDKAYELLHACRTAEKVCVSTADWACLFQPPKSDAAGGPVL